jgi:hypothetical protein
MPGQTLERVVDSANAALFVFWGLDRPGAPPHI